MNANRIAKESLVKEIVDKIKASEALVVAEYAGLTVSETQELRAQLKEKGVELKVYKNRLVRLAMEEAGFGDINSTLTGPNAFAFGMEDGISPAKVLAEFSKKHEALKLKAGTYEGKVIDFEELQVIATLPTFEEALTILAMSMMSPLKNISVGLNMLATEGHLEAGKEAEAPAPKTEEVKEVEVKPEAEEKADESKTEEVVEKVETQKEETTEEVKAESQEETKEAPAANAEEAKEGE